MSCNHCECTQSQKHTHAHEHEHEGNRLITLIRIIISAVMLGISFFIKDKSVLRICILVIAFLIVGYDIVLATLKKLLHFNIHTLFDEEFLMLIASCGAFALGDYPEAVIIMLFYQIGELFQDYAVDRSRNSIEKLMDIRPDFATLYNSDGSTLRVKPEDVCVGQRIIVKPGEKIPLDGIVISGESYLNTAALTGESIPRFVQVGNSVLSGSINTSGLLELEVTSVYSESTAAKILALIESEENSKAKSEKFINRFAKVYTPTVVALAVLLAVLPPLITSSFDFGIWIQRALIFLVISCPCALVISIPLSFFGGIGRASAKGILVKGSACMETISTIHTIAFDKTGTLTSGQLTVSEVKAADGYDSDKLLRIVATAEMNSTHPLARAIVNYFKSKTSNTCGSIDKYNEKAGRGISAQVELDSVKYDVLAGNRAFLTENGIALPAINATSCIYAAVNGEYAGAICVSDTVKPEAIAAVDELKSLGCKVVMLTGDSEFAAQETAKALAIDVRYDLMPEDKVSEVKELMKSGVTAFAGDGINDTPVLYTANVGFAMGGVGSDSAIEAADAVIMDDNPQKLAAAIRIARKTMRIAKQNLIFPLAVKAIIMILSAFGIANMYLAVFADVGVSVLAVLNALRTLRI